MKMQAQWLAIPIVCVFGLLGTVGIAAGGENENPASTKPVVPTPTPIRIMCVGDSITAGYTDNPKWNVPFEFGYRSSLYSLLTRHGYAVQFVGASQEPWNGRFGKPRNTPGLDLRPLNQDRHRGYGGASTGLIRLGIGGWLEEDKPDLILLMIGINDPPGAISRTNLDQIVQTVVTTRPEARLIVAQITPKAGYQKALEEYNTYIRDTLVPSFRARGKRVSTVDQYQNFLKGGKIDRTLFSNGINHPNAAAYERMAQTWFEGIQAIYPGKGSAESEEKKQ